MSRRIAIACIVVVAAVPLVSTAFAFFLIAESIVFERSSTPFSQERWQQAPEGSEERYRLANDLIQSDALIGMQVEAVQEMLGPGHFSETRNALTYSVGDRSLFSLGGRLVVEFNAQRRVTRAFFVRE